MRIIAARKRMITLYATVATVFLSLAICGYYYENNMLMKHARPHGIGLNATDMTYYDLPRMNLQVGSGSKATRMRVDLSIEVAKRDLPILEGYQPKITDRLRNFLGAVNPDDMHRVSTASMLRTDMMDQINRVGMPVPVHEVFLRQLVIM